MSFDDTLPPAARRELDAIDAALAGDPVPPDLTELGSLALALRDERPAPAADFAHDLDARAAAGFPRRRRLAALRAKRRRAPLLIPGTLVAGLAAAVIAVVVVGGGSGGTPPSGGGDRAASSAAGSATSS